ACSIGLAKTPDKSDVRNGAGTPVTYGYKVTNTGDYYSASGTVADDNGTPGKTSDDFTVGSWGPLAPGASQTLQNTRPINATTTNIAVASGTSGGGPVSATDTATVLSHGAGIDLTKTPDKSDVR